MTEETTQETIALSGVRAGEMLRNRREAMGWTYRDVAAMTRIQGRLLQALEDEELEAFDAPAYARGFARLYARELGLDEEAVLRAFPAAAAQPAVVAESLDAPDAPAPVEHGTVEFGSLARRASAAPPEFLEERRPGALVMGAAAALIVMLGAALLLFSGESRDATAAAALHGEEDLMDAWRPAPREYLDWQTVREN